ncbi:MAG: ParB/RepB/Spo0J family partition protein [Oribacterium sp.]|nr:ParB/RepB/Spo0J family partition protein [Oribacterium sp.]
MKANQPKRKVFNDAIDLLTGDAPESGVTMIPVDKVEPFHEHPFKLYQGERLDGMVDSIKEHGVLTPVIVRKIGSGYEMLAGHNRQNAARIAGLKEIPAIVKENLTDEEAWVYVVETNVIQRSFNDLSVTERIAVLATRYDKVCGTKKREEIMEELHRLNGDGGHHVHQQAKSRELIGQEYGMTGRNIARYVRCNQLIPAFKEMLDDGSLTMVVGVEVSFLSPEEQALVFEVMEKNCIKLKKDAAGRLRAAAGTITEESVQSILGLDKPVAEVKRPVSVKLPAKVYHRYFANVAAKDVQGILEEALDLYFERKGA